MDTTTRTIGIMPRAIGLAVAVVIAAALLLSLLAGAIGGPSEAGAPPAAAPTAATAPTAAASPVPEPAGPTALPLPSVPSVPSVPGALVAGTYTVVTGDTLAGIAQRHGVPMELLAADNGIADPDRISAGRVLAMATPPTHVVVIESGATLGGYARQYGTTVGGLLALNPQITDADRILAGAGLRIAS